MPGSPLRPETTVVIILGASQWPLAPKLPSSDAFRQSARGIIDYFVNPHSFGLPNDDDHLLNLFDDEDAPNLTHRRLTAWLRRALAHSLDRGHPIRDLIVYYVGHGGFTPNEQAYYLAIRSTEFDNEGSSSLRMTDLARTLKREARSLRRFLVLDCCFAESAYGIFQGGGAGDPATAAHDKTKVDLPGSGTALLCSSSARDVSLAPKGEKHTMFSGCLLELLQEGIPGIRGRLSLAQVGEGVALRISQKYLDLHVRPKVSTPDETEGDIADLPLFPNPAEHLPVDVSTETNSPQFSVSTLNPDSLRAMPSRWSLRAKWFISLMAVVALIVSTTYAIAWYRLAKSPWTWYRHYRNNPQLEKQHDVTDTAVTAQHLTLYSGAPNILLGQILKPTDLITYLESVGYEQGSGNSRGGYFWKTPRISINPGPESYHLQDETILTFDGDRIQSIQTAEGTRLKAYELEPEELPRSLAPDFFDIVERQLDTPNYQSAQSRDFRVYTSLDPKVQHLAIDSIRSELSHSTNQPQTALVAIDTRTGRVVAYVGGNEVGSGYDAVLMRHQIGSLISPLVYAAAIAKKDATNSNEIESLTRALTVNSGSSNDSQAAIDDATQTLVLKLPLHETASFFRSAGFFVSGDGFFGIDHVSGSPWDVATAYLAIAEGGMLLDPSMLLSVRAKNGDVIANFAPDPRKVLDRQSALETQTLLTKTMRGRSEALRTGQFTSGAAASGIAVISDGSWFVGYSSQLLCVVWVGYRMGSPIEGENMAGPIWEHFMQRVSESRVDTNKSRDSHGE